MDGHPFLFVLPAACTVAPSSSHLISSASPSQSPFHKFVIELFIVQTAEAAPHRWDVRSYRIVFAVLIVRPQPAAACSLLLLNQAFRIVARLAFGVGFSYIVCAMCC
eukprot:GHVU01114081.1.p3 GENE.GHVU01114081.1~~GHVU01114081.1.p3  ORF type:complete len:107 (+),score=14.32 GHVU01114081.1:1360-1680(+)